MIESYDPNMGFNREWFSPSQIINKTSGMCLPPCKNIIYDIKIEKLHMTGEGNSILIYFPDFSFISKNEYVACGWTCMVGELGGNLGFFLGGSVIVVIDLIIEYARKLTNIVKMRIHVN